MQTRPDKNRLTLKIAVLRWSTAALIAFILILTASIWLTVKQENTLGPWASVLLIPNAIFKSSEYVADIILFTGFTTVLLLIAITATWVKTLGQQQVLNNNELRWRFAAEGSGIGLWDWDIETKVVFFSKRWKEMLGYAEDEVGNTYDAWMSLIHPEDFAHGELMLKLHCEGKLPMYECEHRLLCKDGQYKWIHVRGKVMERSSDGQPRRILGTHTDITQRKATENELIKQKKVLMQIVEHQGIATFMIDAQHRVQHWNRACEILTGIDAKDMIGTTNAWQGFYQSKRPCLADLILDGTHEPAINDMYPYETKPVNHALGWYSESWLQGLYGERRFVHFGAVPIFDEKGEIYAVIETLQDLTNTKLVEEEILNHRDHLQELVAAQTADLVAAKEAAEFANQAKSEFLANISHELRTPMHAILSFSELGESKIGKAPPEKIIVYFQRIKTSGERLLRLLNDLLDLSKLEANMMTLEFASCDLQTLLQEALTEYESLSSQKHITLSLDNYCQHPTAEIDALRIGQVIRNILSNSIKFTPEYGKINLSLHESEIPAGRRAIDTKMSPAIKLSISDSGIGIPEDELEKVFDKFVQSSNTKTGAGGTGLGLSICKEIIGAHRGKIYAQNNPDGGTCFNIILPLQSQTISTE